MKPLKRAAVVVAVVLLATLAGVLIVRRTPSLHTEEAVRIAVDAYVYGYPLVTFDTARRQQTNVAAPDGEHAPMGQMIKMRSYPAADNHCCAAPNADTLYTIAWLDVSREPWVFSIPEMGDRYYIMPMLDGFSEVFQVASTRTTGGGAQAYAITGPGWSGALPDGVTRVESRTAMVWVLGRIYCTGTPEDYAAVHALQDRFTVVPLSSYGKPYTPPPGVVDPGFDMKMAVRKQVNDLDIDTYFNRLATLLKTNPPKAQDAEIVARMARIGIIPGQDFDGSQLGSLDREAIKAVPKLALAKMAVYLKEQKTMDGWLYFTSGVGNFGTNYLLRGMANLLGPGWNRPQDAIYPLSQKDAEGHEYDGATHSYVMRFEKGGMPPVEAFWSLTLYDTDFFFVPNPINRYELSQRNTFGTNPDGSVDLFIQAESPGKDKEAQLAAGAEGKVRAGDADVRTEGDAADDRGRLVDAAARQARPVALRIAQESIDHDQRRTIRRAREAVAPRRRGRAADRGHPRPRLRAGRPGVVLRPAGLSVRLPARRDGPHQGPGDRGGIRRRDRGPDQPVCRHDEVPGRLVPGGSTDRPRHAVRDRVGRPRQGTAGAVGAGHGRTLLRDRAVRHVEQRLHIDRHAEHRHRRGELPDRRAPLAGHAARRRQGGVPLARRASCGSTGRCRPTARRTTTR